MRSARLAIATAAPRALLSLDQGQVEQLARWRNEPAWLLEARLRSLARFTPESWPTGLEEEWRRFPLADLPRTALIREPDGSDPPSEYGSVPVEAAHKGVIFDRWVDAIGDHPDLVRRWLDDGEGIASHAAFRALNGAAFGHGAWPEFQLGENMSLYLLDPTNIGREFEGPHTSAIALRVPDVEAARTLLAAKGVEFRGETFDTGVCHMAIFRDPDGNELMLHRRYAD